jgi:hypothetical protein
VFIAVATLWAFRGALRYGFSQDDVAGLARAMGLAPRLATPLRYLSHQAYFDLMHALAGLNPAPYHIASLVVLAACAILLRRLLSRWLSPAGGVLGTTFFCAHPALFHTGYWIIAIGDSLALLFGLLAIRATFASGGRRWLAVPLFAISLLCKESTILLPVVAWVLLAHDRRVRPVADDEGRLVDPVVIAMIVLAGALAAVFGVSRATGTGGLSYPVGFGPHLLDNALTYLGWTAQSLAWVVLSVNGFTDAVDRTVWSLGIGLLAGWLVGLAIPSLRHGGWLAGGLVFALLLLPVLPLRDHTYHYYLTAPLIGAALSAGALLDAIVARFARRRDAAATAFLTAALGALPATFLAGAGEHAVREIETHPFLDPGSRADPILDRALILDRAIRDVRDAGVPAGTVLRFWSPVARQRQRATHPEAALEESYWERNVRTALLDGLAVRVFVPAVREAAFVRDFAPAPDDVRFALYLPDGHVHVATSAELEAGLAHVPGAR